MVRTRFAPSPTGQMHIGNLKTALVEYLIAKAAGGKFILRIEDTDQNRLTEGAVNTIYETLKLAGINHDEGPDVGGDFGPYTQSERVGLYKEYALKLVKAGHAYYCFCPKERLETLKKDNGADALMYDRHCLNLPEEEVAAKLAAETPYVIRQLIPAGKTRFKDEVFGEIEFDNSELDDQVLIKSDGFATYNFANVVDDHLMEITHVIRGAEYLSSTPKYNLLYDAFGWQKPLYVHRGLLLNENGEKMSKRRGDPSFEDLIEAGFLPEAIVNYVALLGWSPPENREIYSLDELAAVYGVEGMSKAPSTFDIKKLTWFNSEYIKKMPFDAYFEKALPYIKENVKRDIDLKKLAEMTQTRVDFIKDCGEMVDFFERVNDFPLSLYESKKMKTTVEVAKSVLASFVTYALDIEKWDNDALYVDLCSFADNLGFKRSQVLWTVRTALSGKKATPCGATEIMALLGKDETLDRLRKAL